MKFNYEFDSKSIFDPIKAEKTKQINGGIDIWGNAITWPSELNFFSRGSREWKEVGFDLQKSNIQKYFPRISISDNKVSEVILRRLESLLPNIEEEFVIDKHGYSDYPSAPNGFEKIRSTILKGKVQSLKHHGAHGGWIQIVDENSEVQIIRYRKVVFASGTITNAYLVSLFTGQNNFSLGNHISTTVGQISLSKAMNFRGIYQSFARKETQFITFSLKDNNFNCQSSIRVIPRKKLSLKVRIFESIMKMPFFSLKKVNLRRNAYLAVDLLRRMYGLNTLDTSFSLRVLSEIALQDRPRLQFRRIGENEVTIQISLNLENESKQEIFLLLEKFAKLVEKSKKVSSFEYEKMDVERLKWEDAGHYFGSVPISDNWSLPSVNGNLELKGTSNIFVIGNSAHAVGSHGHPTCLTVLLAARLAKYLLDSRNV